MNFDKNRILVLPSRDIRVKLLYRSMDSNYLWREYDIEFPDIQYFISEFGEKIIKDAKSVTKVIKDFLVNDEKQDINIVLLQTNYISIGKDDMKIIADVITSKNVIRQLKIDDNIL
jgi:uncharacterized protein Usg